MNIGQNWTRYAVSEVNFIFVSLSRIFLHMDIFIKCMFLLLN